MGRQGLGTGGWGLGKSWGQLELFVVENCNFSRHADVSQAVGAIAGDFEIDADIAAGVLDGLQVEAGQHQTIGHVLGLEASEIDVLLKPGPGDEHGKSDRISNLRFEI